MHTVIVGGGFAGVKAAIEIAKKNIGKVTLISDEPHFLHHATLYSTATGRSHEESVVPLETIFAPYPNVTVVQDRMKSIDPRRKLVVGKKKNYTYQTLILAIGVVTTYFNIDGMAKHSYGIKTLKEVKKFNAALHDFAIKDQRYDTNYVVIGAGPTGVELAGALAEYLKKIGEAHHLKRQTAKLLLVEAAPRILPRSSETASRNVQARLEKLGVKVMTNSKVQALDDDFIYINGKKVATHTAVWTSGVANHPFFAEHPDYFKLAPNGRVLVNQYLEAYPGIYVLGDNASTKYTGLAWNALDDATFVADHLARKIAKRPLKARRATAPPSGIPVGEEYAYVEWHGVYASGRLGAWLRRRIELVGFKQLLPRHAALKAWRAHDKPEEHCRLCKNSEA